MSVAASVRPASPKASHVSDGELSCRELVEVVNDYLEGDMALAEQARFERHLDLCPDCVVHLQQMRETIAALGRLSPDEPEPEVRDGLLQAFRDWRG
jgi:anti-sigma factor RsiW